MNAHSLVLVLTRYVSSLELLSDLIGKAPAKPTKNFRPPVIRIGVFREELGSADDISVAIIIIRLTLVYLTEIPTRFSSWTCGTRLIGLWQVLADPHDLRRRATAGVAV
jgi:hypothetical protein